MTLKYRGKSFMKDTSVVTPVGLLLVLFALVAGYQTITRGPAFLMAGIVLMTYVVIRTLAVQAGRQIIDGRSASLENRDPWARPSRRDRKLQRRALNLNIALTQLTSLFPTTSLRGRGFCEKLGYA